MDADVITRWKLPVLLLAGSIAGLVLMLHETLSSMIGVWDSSSETYAHGYVILPISLWLIWRKRELLSTLVPRPDYRAIGIVLILSFGWLFGRVSGAQVIEHYMLVGLAISFVWALLGWRIVWTNFFPLTFLVMMVPAGEFMVEPLIYFTADFTVFMVQAIGIPVFREGTFFSLPTGEWSVVTGCSGIRYFLSSVVLGWLFAYLTYQTWWKRAAFGIAALIVPIVANGFRATMIVLIAHFSDMQLALGVDHFIYGWVWFGIVMLVMFGVGNIWREDGKAPTPTSCHTSEKPPSKKTFIFISLALVTLVAIFWAYEKKLDDRLPSPSPLSRFVATNGWAITEQAVTNWRPEWTGMNDERVINLQKGEDHVLLFMGWYGTQRQGSELINEKSTLVREKHPEWRKTIQKKWQTEILGHHLEANRALLDAKAKSQPIVVLQWNRLSGHDTVNIFRAKIELAINKLFGKPDSGAVVILSAPYQGLPKEADAALQRFLEDMKPSIDKTLDQTSP